MSSISLHAPGDGGTPRDPARIICLGPDEFLVRACAQEEYSSLTHPVSRVDLVCSNAGGQPATVVLHLDLSGDGLRTNLEDNLWGGMAQRDFVFVQPPGGGWQQIDGATDGTVCTVRFTAQPGDTKIGLSPWYTYGDLLCFVKNLPEHPHLRKTPVGLSDGGREQWELVITDPSVTSEAKQRIFWHAREHSYEAFSSFAIEGAIAYLLGEEAAEIRREFEITLHPMTNVDGVAEGHEYGAGYDLPGPQTTASGRLTFATVDRLQPYFIVTWHNWIAPRDMDTLFYTDGERGRPSRRAWDLFTQRFPSPRSAEHRWEAEEDPLAKNWFQRELDPANVHQYAMMRYGTRVWGWEMTWWRRSVEEARRMGSVFAQAFFACLPRLGTDGSAPEAEAAVPQVPRWEMHEFSLHGRCHVDNPFGEASLVGHFTSPAGRTVVVDGFYDGGDVWRLRFSPDEEGEWHYLLRGEGVELSQRGRLQCIPPRGHGFIGIHPENPYAFAYRDGTPFFPMGDTCYGLHADSCITPELRTQYLSTRRSHRFNYVRMGVVHSPTHWESDRAFWPWGGTPKSPDLDRLNPDYFQRLDAVLAEMKAAGMNAELLLLNFYQWPFTDTGLWTAARERAWLRYLLARYGAFTNVFLWTISNEYETHPDGAYRLDLPEDVDWVKATARFLKRHDPYRHPVTVHPVISASTQGRTPADPFDPPWRIGEFFGADDALDVLSQQTGQRGTYDDVLFCWTGGDPHLVASLRADRRFGKPVLNSENGYEYLRGYPDQHRQEHHTDKVRRSSWRIVCAGGYFAAGFLGTLGHSDFWDPKEAPKLYPFVVRDEGAAAQLAALYDFFTGLPFWRMEPFDGVTDPAVALADPGRVYVVYLPEGGSATVDLGGATGPLIAQWLDPRTGERGRTFRVKGGEPVQLTAPDRSDWALEIRVSCGAMHYARDDGAAPPADAW